MSMLSTSTIELAKPQSGSKKTGAVSSPIDRYEPGADWDLSQNASSSHTSWQVYEPTILARQRPVRRTDVYLAPRDEQEPDLLAEWNGYVQTISQHFFEATLNGVYGEGVEGQIEDAEIPIQDVSESDRELLKPGAVFRLCVFYTVTTSGQPRRYTEVVFRRVAAYRPKDLDVAKERAKLIYSQLRVE